MDQNAFFSLLLSSSLLRPSTVLSGSHFHPTVRSANSFFPPLTAHTHTPLWLYNYTLSLLLSVVARRHGDYSDTSICWWGSGAERRKVFPLFNTWTSTVWIDSRASDYDDDDDDDTGAQNHAELWLNTFQYGTCPMCLRHFKALSIASHNNIPFFRLVEILLPLCFSSSYVNPSLHTSLHGTLQTLSLLYGFYQE